MEARVQCVITGDVVGSSALSRQHLANLMQRVERITLGKEGYLPQAPARPSIIPSQWATVFRGDSFQMVCQPLEGMLHLILLRLFFKSYPLHWEQADKTCDARLSLALNFSQEDQSLAYEQAFRLSGAGLDTQRNTKMVVSVFEDLELEDELHAYGVLVDAILTPITPKQARNLLYLLLAYSATETAEALGVAPSTISRSIEGLLYPLKVVLARFSRRITPYLSA